jgi:hypothetical protein
MLQSQATLKLSWAELLNAVHADLHKPITPIIVLEDTKPDTPYYTRPWYSENVRDAAKDVVRNHADETLHSQAENGVVRALAGSQDVYVERRDKDARHLRSQKNRWQKAEREAKKQAEQVADGESNFNFRTSIVVDAFHSYERGEAGSSDVLFDAIYKFILTRVQPLDWQYGDIGPKTAEDYAQEKTFTIWRRSLGEWQANLPQKLLTNPGVSSGEFFRRWLSTVADRLLTQGGRDLGELQRDRVAFEVIGEDHHGDDKAIKENPEVFHLGYTLPLKRDIVNCEETPADERCKHAGYKSGREELNSLHLLPHDETDRAIVKMLQEVRVEDVESHDNNDIDETTRQYLAPGAGVWVERRRVPSQTEIAERQSISARAVRKRLEKMGDRYQKIKARKNS